jgi:hypothetical protein
MRFPNPWIAIPSLVAGFLGALLGWLITDISCQVDTSALAKGCPGQATLVAVLAFVLTTVGMAVVMSLVSRSIAEWRDRTQGPRTED